MKITKKLLSALLLLPLIGANVQAQTTTILSSGIDWNSSTIEVSLIPNQESDIENWVAWECQGETFDAPTAYHQSYQTTVGVTAIASIPLADWSLNKESTIGGCFTIAGTYTLSLLVQDFAGNASTETGEIVVTPTSPNVDQTTFESIGDCSTGVVADGQSGCSMELVLKDQYGNQNTQYDGEDADILKSGGIFVNDANRGISFLEGVKIDGTSLGVNSTVSKSLSKGKSSFDVTSITPSLKEANNKLTYQAESFIPLTVKIPGISVNSSGIASIDVSSVVTLPGISLNPIFKAPFAIVPEGAPINGEMFFNAQHVINLLTSGVGSSTFNNITNFNVEIVKASGTEKLTYSDKLIPHDNTGLNISDWAIPGDILEREIGNTETKLTGIKEGETVGDTRPGFLAIVSYILDGKNISYVAGSYGVSFDEVDTGVTPTPPGGFTGGGAEEIEVKYIGVDIEGGTLGGKADITGQAFADNAKTFSIGDSVTKDYREPILQNVTKLKRGVEKSAAVLDTSFSDKDFVWVTGNVRISQVLNSGTLPSGANTLLIQNGNLIIDTDVEYADSEKDSFAVVLLNDIIESYPTKGNIYVEKNVRVIHGTFYADGGLMPTTSGTTRSYSELNATDPKDQQLLLVGNLLTFNTIGGYVPGETADTPWEKIGLGSTSATEKQKENAIIYDLNYVRRYAPGTESPSNAVDSSYNVGSAAFTIRPDRRSSIISPPGFDSNIPQIDISQ